MADIVFFDLETRSDVDLGRHNLHRYARDSSTEILVATFHFPDGTEGIWAPERRWTGDPTYDAVISDDLVHVWNRWVKDGGLVCAWNIQFDRTILKYVQSPLTCPKIEQTLCAQTMAENYSLPGRLGNAGAALGVEIQKDSAGKGLIKQLSIGQVPWNPKPDTLWAFWQYALRDTVALKAAFDKCRPWTAEEWTDYHVVERMNERGIPIDVGFAKCAAQFAAAIETELNSEIVRVTGDKLMTLSKSQRKIAWLRAQLAGTELEAALQVTVKRKGKKAQSWSTGKNAIRALKQRYDELDQVDAVPVAPEVWDHVTQFMDILDRGNGVATKKFVTMLDTHVDGKLYHQYRCSPTITGRHAARGVQLDNVLRKGLPKVDGIEDSADWAIDKLAMGHSTVVTETFGLPLAKVLARLIRPTILAPTDDTYLVWGDWSAIEARVLPWLAKAEDYLDVFRKGECIYCQDAMDIFPNAWPDWQTLYHAYKEGDDKATYCRLVGKVARLALGYQGGVVALGNMARTYDLILDARLLRRIKDTFRAANSWLTQFWSRLNDAAWTCVNAPGIERTVGRLRYCRYGQDLVCWLPDGRPIVYPQVRIRRVFKEVLDREVDVITYRKIWSKQAIRGEIYGGVLTENATQGVATGSLLRALLRRLDGEGFDLRASKHDEVLLATRTGEDPQDVADQLKLRMEETPEWAEGLPLKADVRWGAYYGK